MRIPRRSVAAFACLFGAVVLASCYVPPSGAPVVQSVCSGTWTTDTTGTVSDASLNEVSGVVASRAHPGVLWVHNDSGDSARIFALSMTGTVLATFNVTGATATDWEDIAIGPGPQAGITYLYVGDIGDNLVARPNVDVYRIAEPAVDAAAPPIGTQSVAAERLRFTYPDGAHNAETLLADTNGQLSIVTKQSGSGSIYQAPINPAGGSTSALTAAGTITFGGGDLFVGGDISPAGDAVLLRTYFRVYAWNRATGTPLGDVLTSTPCDRALLAQQQGEAIGFLSNTPGFVTMSEGVNQPIHRYRPPVG